MDQQPPDEIAPQKMTSPMVLSFYAAVLFVAVVWAGLSEAGVESLWRLPVERALPGWLAGVLVGLTLVLVTAIAEPLMPSLRSLSAEIAGLVAPITAGRVVVFALSSGIAEEALFRGPVQNTLGYVVASVLFALLHGGVSARYIAWSTFALVAGLSFGLLADQYASIWPSVIAHVVVNAINLARLARVTPETDDQGQT
jgi:uncharacterized protein